MRPISGPRHSAPAGETSQASSSRTPVAPRRSLLPSIPCLRPAAREAAEGDRPPRISDEAMRQFLEKRQGERYAELDVLRQAVRPDGHDGLAQKKQEHAAYLTARIIDGRPVEGADLDRLRRGENALLETRALLDVGRGNVDKDIEATKHASTRRTKAARQLASGIVSEPPTLYVKEAASALLARAGHCGEFAGVAAYAVGDKVQPDEEAHIVSAEHMNIDHAFVELRTREGRDHDVVIDGWSAGPAVFATDGHFSKGEPAPPSELALDPAAAQRFATQVRGTLDTLRETKSDEFEAKFTALERRRFRLPPAQQWGEQTVVSTEFAERVYGKTATMTKARLPPPPGRSGVLGRLLDVLRPKPDERIDHLQPLRPEIVATGVVRDMGQGVKTATARAEDISDRARRLDRPG